MNWLRWQAWRWRQAGLALGLLNTAAFYTVDYHLSVSTTFSRAAGMLVGCGLPRSRRAELVLADSEVSGGLAGVNH